VAITSDDNSHNENDNTYDTKLAELVAFNKPDNGQLSQWQET
jgi:hypothetical protein